MNHEEGAGTGFQVTTPPGAGASAILVGKRIGDYRMDAVMGEGPHAYVYQGLQCKLNRTVAIKILRAEHAGDSERIEDFLEGTRRAASLIHPRIVQVYDVVSRGDLHFAVMELIQAQTLDTWLDPGRRLPLGETLHLGMAVCEALLAAARVGLEHGDLHPANVFLVPGSGARMGDFCLHPFPSGRVPASERELQRAVFVAPECFARGRDSGKGDIYSLGVMLYRLLAGELPFSPAAIRRWLRDSSLRPPVRELVGRAAVAHRLPPALEELLGGMLAADPRQRPGVEQVLEVLRAEGGRLGDKAGTRLLEELGRRGLSLPPVSRRRYRRLRSDLRVQLKPRKTSSESAIMLLSKIRNLGENGAFVSCAEPLPEGTFVNLRFDLEDRRTRVEVVGIVRWVEREREQPGMGIQFIEVSTSDRRRIRSFVDARLVDEMRQVLVSSHMHKAILRILLCSWGQELSFERMRSITGASRMLLQRTLADFQRFNLLRVEGETITCAGPPGREVVQALDQALRGK